MLPNHYCLFLQSHSTVVDLSYQVSEWYAVQHDGDVQHWCWSSATEVSMVAGFLVCQVDTEARTNSAAVANDGDLGDLLLACLNCCLSAAGTEDLYHWGQNARGW